MDNIHLSAAEKGFLWSTYMENSMAVCILKYFLEKCEDQQIKEVIKYAYNLSQQHVNSTAELLAKENHPIPMGFSNDDVDLSAPKLFLDEFLLYYLMQMGNLGLLFYSKALGMTAHEDVHNLYKECIRTSSELNSNAKELLLSKGLYVRPPYIPNQSESEMIEKIGFLQGFLGEKRPLTALEITNLFFNLQTIEVSRVLFLAFAQVSESEDVRDYLTRGKDLGTKALIKLRELLEKEELASSTPWYSYVSNTTESPFSDKLMMFHASSLIGAGIEQYGYSLSTIMRRDVGALYYGLLAEVMTFADDGLNLMIKNHWMEQPPMAAERQH